ncbi:single-stranded-DNA-specific exonuclease RecJ [Chloroflexota bacterium]
MSDKLWNVLPACPNNILHKAQIPPVIVQILYNRGMTDPDHFHSFLNCELTTSCDPFALPDMHQAVSRIYRALLGGEKMVVFGDFDADGITAAALLVEGLESLGAQVYSYLPHRVFEGHGLNITALEEFQQDGVSLVITADCGIASVAEAVRAKELGIDVLITDHHTIQSEIPYAVAIVNPKRPGSTYPFRDLAGVGVAYKILEALTSGAGRDNILEGGLELVALGTIADMSPLIGENRYLVRRGLESLNTTKRLGLIEMLRECRLEMGHISAESVAWVLAPRLNAAGRLEHARIGYNMLRTSSQTEAGKLAKRLDEINRERQRLVDVYWKRAREEVATQWVSSPVVLIESDPEQPLGISGLVAGRLMEEFNRPTVVMQVGEDSVRGSCRSIPEFDIVSALSSCSDLLIQFGGHPSAAGFTLNTASLKRFKERLHEIAESELAVPKLRSEITIDAEIDPLHLLGEPMGFMKLLEPFGKGNPPPKFLSRNLKVLEARLVGNGGQHLKLKLRGNRVSWPAIGFGLGSRAREVSTLVDIVYIIKTDGRNPDETVELEILDFQPSS